MPKHKKHKGRPQDSGPRMEPIRTAYDRVKRERDAAREEVRQLKAGAEVQRLEAEVRRLQAEIDAEVGRRTTLEEEAVAFVETTHEAMREVEIREAMLRAEVVQIVPAWDQTERPGGGVFEQLAKDGITCQRTILGGNGWLIFAAGVPADTDRAKAMAYMIQRFAADHGAEALVLGAPEGYPVDKAFGFYRVVPVQLVEAQPPASAVEADPASPIPGTVGEMRPREPGDPPPEPGAIADPAAYAAAVAEGRITPIERLDAETLAEAAAGDPAGAVVHALAEGAAEAEDLTGIEPGTTCPGCDKPLTTNRHRGASGDHYCGAACIALCDDRP